MKKLMSKTQEELSKIGAKAFVSEENKARIAEMNEKMKAVEREFKIRQKQSWESAAKVVLNS